MAVDPSNLPFGTLVLLGNGRVGSVFRIVHPAGPLSFLPLFMEGPRFRDGLDDVTAVVSVEDWESIRRAMHERVASLGVPADASSLDQARVRDWLNPGAPFDGPLPQTPAYFNAFAEVMMTRGFSVDQLQIVHYRLFQAFLPDAE